MRAPLRRTALSTTSRGRRRAGVSARFFGLLVSAIDLLPPRARYSYAHRATRRLFSRPLPTLGASSRRTPTAPVAAADGAADVTCLLAADHLGVGGIGSVVEMLAGQLTAWGVRPVVLCPGGGSREGRLREAGVEVIVVTDERSARSAIDAVRPQVVQLHSAPPFIEDAALASGRPLIPVMHNMEIHFTRQRWAAFSRLMARSASGVAVSETVRAFHARQLPAALADRIAVIPNGAPPVADEPKDRDRARHELEAAVGTSLDDAVVFVTLARYDAQKNIAGTVASFLRAAEEIDTPVHLVVAGEPSDWAEFRRADALARSSRWSDRVHLLGNSDPTTLLAAGDAFVLNSFFEGWPVAATEAAVAGLPLLLSDVGGAPELVMGGAGRSVLVANACGEAGAISDARVRVARRRTRHQPNQDELVAAVRSITRLVTSGSGYGRDRDRLTGLADMARSHAGLIRTAAAASGADRPVGD